MTDIGEIALIFMSVRDQLKIYHFQTSMYSRHKSSDMLVDSLTQHMDKFIETIQGSRGRRLAMPRDNKNILDNQDDNSIVSLLYTFKDWLIRPTGLPKYLNKDDTDLFNMRDEILGDVNQTLYLFTFK